MNTQIEDILEEREKTHGPYDEFARLVQNLKYFVHIKNMEKSSRLSSEHLEAIDMILHKIGRIVTGDPDVKDHWDDIAGYATLGGRYVRSVQET